MVEKDSHATHPEDKYSIIRTGEVYLIGSESRANTHGKGVCLVTTVKKNEQTFVAKKAL